MDAAGPTRVLLVEDDAAYAAMITTQLTTHGTTVEWVPTVSAAMARLRSTTFDAILLDLALPDSSGVDTLDRVYPVAGLSPIVVLTGRDDDALALQAVQRGAQDYILKGDADGRLLTRAIRYARERAGLQRELVERETRFRALVEHSADAITLVDEHGVSLYNSRAVETMSGYTPGELLGRRIDTLAHPVDMPTVRARFVECRARPGEPVRLEFRYLHRDGTWRFAEGVMVNRLDDASVRAIVVNHRDVTGHKETEEALRTSEDRLRQSQKMEAVGRLAGGVAHDFNNVLTAIFGYSDLLRDQLSPGDPRRDDVDEIRRSAERAASLTRQLLAFSRKQVMQPRVLNLNEVVGNIRSLLAKLIGTDVSLDFQPAGDAWPVKADPGQIEQVLMNLATNARDAMPEGGHLAIATSNMMLPPDDVRAWPGLAPGAYVRLTVSDDGAGMPDAVRHNIFEPFFTTKEQGKGTGLGLATVYGIIKQTGGGIYVQSEEGKGTRFDILLPRAPQS
jgi:PAS domain S-box-containing protein